MNFGEVVDWALSIDLPLCLWVLVIWFVLSWVFGK